jgi:hypothetical protein
VKTVALRFGLVGGVALALAAACGSDDEDAGPKPNVPKDARADVPAEAPNDTGADTRDASADASIDGSDAGAEAGDARADSSDAGADTSADGSDADPTDGGSDASDGAAEADAALPLVPCAAVAGRVSVAGSPDGKQVAFLSCAKSSPAVVVYTHATGASVELGPAPADSSVEWLIDGKHVYYGSTNESYVRAADITADGAGPAVRVSTGVINGHRAFEERINNTQFAPRLMVLETEGSVRRISVRKPDDGYATRLVLIEDAALALDISQLSDSGRTLIATVSVEAGPAEYRKIRTNLAQATTILPFGPNDWVMAPTGLGDTHNFAFNGDRLVRVQLDTGAIAELVPAGSGLLPGTDHLFDREESPGVKYAHFIQNGDPSRRIREGTSPTEVLATANAVAQVLSRDITTVLYLSDQQLFAVSAVGGGAAARPLTTAANTTTALNIVFSETTRDFAYVVDHQLFRISLANDAVQPLSTTANPAAVKFDGLGQSILFMTDAGALQRATPTATTPDTIEPAVQGFWPVPATSMVVVSINGQLSIRTLSP